MSEESLIPLERIEGKIYVVRGERVMLFCLDGGARLLEGSATDETNTKILGVTDLANRKPRRLIIVQANRRPDSNRAKPPGPKTDYRTIF